MARLQRGKLRRMGKREKGRRKERQGRVGNWIKRGPHSPASHVPEVQILKGVVTNYQLRASALKSLAS